MNIIANQAATMTSREIAELTGKEHKNVKRDIRSMLGELVLDALNFERTYLDGSNREQKEFALDKELTETLLTGYSAPLRRAVIRRWQELEQRFQVPETLGQALQLAADQQKQIESLATKIKGDAPKVVFADKWMNSPETYSLTQAAKIVGLPPRFLIELMAKDKLIFKPNPDATWEPYQRRIEQGVMVLVPVERGDNTYKQAKVTGKGLIFLNKRYNFEGLRDN